MVSLAKIKRTAALLLSAGLVLFSGVTAADICRSTAKASGDSAAFPSQQAALSTSTVRGLLGDISAEVRGPAASYTLTIDAADGNDLRSLMADTRYNILECYNLSLTAVNSQEVTRNPQFGDATITIPIGSSMNPDKGTFAVYTVGRDGELEKLSCDVVYGNTAGYAVRFMTIHFSTYGIAYTNGGSTRVTGSRKRSSASSGIATISNTAAGTADTVSGTADSATNAAVTAGSTDQTGTGNNASASTTGTTDNAAAATVASTDASASTAASVAAVGKDENGKDPYDHPKTGDRRFYGTICTAIIITGLLFIAIARSKTRV